jgi:hypothetical protein
MDISSLVNNSANAALVDALYNPSGAKSVGQIASDMLLDKDTTSPAATSFIQYYDEKDSASISNFASKLSEVDKELKASGNQKAINGLREVAKSFASKPDEFSNFMKSVDKLDKKDFEKVFSTAGDVSKKGINIAKFTSAVTSINDEESTGGFLDSVNKVLKDMSSTVAEKGKVIDNLSSAVTDVERADTKQTDKTDKLSGLFASVSKTSTLTDISKILIAFK